MEPANSSFSSISSYLRSLSQIPRRLSQRACSVTTTYEEMSRVRSRSGPDMSRTLTWRDLVGFGLGGMVGAGVFIASGRAAREFAGPAVVVSYAIAGLCALLSAFCYTEFAVDMPVAGGAFSYLRVTFGEFSAFITGANLIMDYVFSNAAVARGFTSYLGTAIGIDASIKWRISIGGLPDGFNQIDLIAVAVVIVISVCICYSNALWFALPLIFTVIHVEGYVRIKKFENQKLTPSSHLPFLFLCTKESSLLNMLLTALHVLFILFIIIMGFWRGDTQNFIHPADPTKNLGGFFPNGASGVFYGAATVYLSYIGYDAVSTMAEEVKNPTRDIPIGVSGSVAIVTVLYCLMAASMSMLVPYDAIDVNSPFSAAFKGLNGWGWVSNMIGVGASFGILTSLLVSMLGQARYLCVIARSNVVPAWLAKVNPTTSTPVNASAFLGVFTAAIALFTELDILLNLVSIGTLFVFYMVANAVVYRRYVSVGSTEKWQTAAFLLSFTIVSTVFTLLWHFMAIGTTKAVLLGGCMLAAVGILYCFQYFVPQARKPEFWGVPLMPWIPSISIFLNVFLLGSMDGGSYVRFAFFTVLAILVYVLYSVHATYDAEEDGGFVKGGEGGSAEGDSIGV